jgi:hypothetical protein
MKRKVYQKISWNCPFKESELFEIQGICGLIFQDFWEFCDAGILNCWHFRVSEFFWIQEILDVRALRDSQSLRCQDFPGFREFQDWGFVPALPPLLPTPKLLFSSELILKLSKVLLYSVTSQPRWRTETSGWAA